MPGCQNSYCTILSSLPYQKTKAAFDDWRHRNQNSNGSSSCKKRNSVFPIPHISPSLLWLLHKGTGAGFFPQLPAHLLQPLKSDYSSSVRRACDLYGFFVVLFSDKQQSRQLMWDVNSLFVRQGAAATCWHPVMFRWKGFSFCVCSHGRFQGWKHIERRWCTSCWAWRNFSCVVPGCLSPSSLSTHGPCYCTFPFTVPLSLFLKQGCSALALQPGEDQMPLPHWNSETMRRPELTRSFTTLPLN